MADRELKHRPPWLWLLAATSALLVLIADVNNIAVGDDGVGYRAIADSLLAGHGLRYFLEDPLTIWPPIWPALMAGIAKITPLDPTGAAILLNALTAAAAVLLGHRLLCRTVGSPTDTTLSEKTGPGGLVRNQRLVLLGTLVIALGASSIGFGHLLMTDFAFAVLVMAWMLALMNFRDSGKHRWLIVAAALVWLGFGLRYVALYLLGLGGLWLLLDVRRHFGRRLADGVLYGVIGLIAPAAWMLRNRALDGTFTGERMPSARGPIDNGFDILASMGRWLLPGVATDATYMWAAIGGIVLVISVWLGWRVLVAAPRRTTSDTQASRFFAWLGRPSGLLAVQAFGYLGYMLYVRSTTALNKLDLRLLNPAYFSLVALALVLVARLDVLDGTTKWCWSKRGMAVAYVWACANIALGLIAVVTFAAGAPFFEGNYNSDTFVAVRANPALAALPAGCDLYSNLPNALYPRLESHWSPRRTGIESSKQVDDLEQLAGTLDSKPSCLIWVDEQPTYGHLWTLPQLKRRLDLELLDRDGPVSVYRLEKHTA